MNFVEPAVDVLEAFSAEAVGDKPVVMLNLLRFREQAAYAGQGQGEGQDQDQDQDQDEHKPASGRKAYARYSKGVMPLLLEVGGLPRLMGKVRFELIAPSDEKWDEFMLVYYPSRAAFLKMVNSAPYQAILHHRQAALLDSRLIEIELSRVPRVMLFAISGLVRFKALFSPIIR